MPWLYQRRRKADRPRCPLCGWPFWAGSTQRAVTYYYPGCRCLVLPAKAIRARVWVDDLPATGETKAA